MGNVCPLFSSCLFFLTFKVIERENSGKIKVAKIKVRGVRAVVVKFLNFLPLSVRPVVKSKIAAI